MLRKNTHTSRSSKQASLGRKRLNNVKSTCKYNRVFWQFTQWGSNRDWTVHDLRPTYGSSLASHLTTDPRGRQSYTNLFFFSVSFWTNNLINNLQLFQRNKETLQFFPDAWKLAQLKTNWLCNECCIHFSDNEWRSLLVVNCIKYF